ncbi:MAG: hypothetical protein V1913_17690 [Fibrobacterota bacterium]
MKKMLARTIIVMAALLLFLMTGCSQTPEGMGDNFMAMAEKA